MPHREDAAYDEEESDPWEGRALMQHLFTEPSHVHCVRWAKWCDHVWVLLCPMTWDWIPKGSTQGNTYFTSPGSSRERRWLARHTEFVRVHPPWPEFLTSTVRAFHTDDAWLPRHAKPRQGKLLRPLQNVPSFAFVVDVMAVDPESRENDMDRLDCTFWKRGRGGVSADIARGVFSNPVGGIQYTDISEAMPLQVCGQICVQLSLLGST